MKGGAKGLISKEYFIEDIGVTKMNEEDFFYLKESEAIINPIYKGKYILYRCKSQHIIQIYNSFEDFLLSDDKDKLSCSKAYLKTKNQIIDDLKFKQPDSFNRYLHGLSFFNNLENLEIIDPLLTEIGIFNMYDLFRSEIYGIARNGDYEQYLYEKAFDGCKKDRSIYKTLLDEYQELSEKQKLVLNNSHSEAHVMFSHHEYLDYLNGKYQKDYIDSDGGFLLLKIDKKLALNFGFNDEFHSQCNNLKIFL